MWYLLTKGGAVLVMIIIFKVSTYLLYFAWADQRRRQYYIHHTERFLNELYYITRTVLYPRTSVRFAGITPRRPFVDGGRLRR